MTDRRAGDYRRRLIAQIHIAKAFLGLDEDAYRVLLRTETGNSSCSDMTVPQLVRVVGRMRLSGWKPARRLSPMSAHRKDKSLVDKIRALWIDMGAAGIVADASEPALERWVKRQTAKANGIGVDRLDWLERDRRLAVMVLESLKGWRARRLRGSEGQPHD